MYQPYKLLCKTGLQSSFYPLAMMESFRGPFENPGKLWKTLVILVAPIGIVLNYMFCCSHTLLQMH